ncbi:thymidylate kinase family [Cryptosporidium bovis]|uniref:thymidylate kinase family n=1 Tax=Cryptosporidium bovis TaxID=310047 RepID=UPI003519E630|nr:thymidylate kinase family [Cryptosporidium bovis]
MENRGFFIVLEGTDRSGKTLHSNMIRGELERRGEKCILVGFPDRKTEIGKILDLYLRKQLRLSPEVSHLLFCANRWELNDYIKQQLGNGVHVICDRYSFSGVAYSSGAVNLDIEWCKSPEKGLVSPDIVLFLDTNLEICSERTGFGEEIYENTKDQQNVYDSYKHFLKYPYWHSINASRDPQVVSNEIISLLEKKLLNRKLEPLKCLW